VLAAADAVVELTSSRGTREVPLTSFYTGYRQTVARPDELIAAFHIAALSGKQWFRKVGTRAAQAISKWSSAGIAGEKPRLAAGSVAPTVVRLTKTEAALAAGSSIAEAQRAILATSRQSTNSVRRRSTAAGSRRISIAQFCRETKIRA